MRLGAFSPDPEDAVQSQVKISLPAQELAKGFPLQHLVQPWNNTSTGAETVRKGIRRYHSANKLQERMRQKLQ